MKDKRSGIVETDNYLCMPDKRSGIVETDNYLCMPDKRSGIVETDNYLCMPVERSGIVETDNYLCMPDKRSGADTDNYLSLRILLMLLLLATLGSNAQNSRFKPLDFSDSVYQVSGGKLIMPAVLIGYGFAQFSIDPIVDLNLHVRREFTNRIHADFRIDDYTQYAPAAAVYGFNLLGIKGKHDFIDRSIILGTSAIVMGISVNGIKRLTHIQRPDESAFNAFPSGHTATAFACAEFLFQEYKEISVWYGIAGYTIATGTGFLRMYNNRHWLTDVVAGAGFGILSTRIAYWVFPKIKKLLFKDISVTFSLMPSFDPVYGKVR